MSNINANYIKSIQKQFRDYKNLGNKTIDSLSEEQLHWKYNDESSSAATIINHIVGNMFSRWTNFYIEDGEKEWRQRDAEFTSSTKTKEELLEHWEEGWNCLFNIIDNLTEENLTKIIKIRNEDHTVIDAIHRQLAHYPYHIGQLIYIAKMLKNNDWKSLSIPRNKSDEFNKKAFNK